MTPAPGSLVSELINHNNAGCIISAHGLQNAGNAFETDALMHHFAWLQSARLAHGEHSAKPLSLHAEGSEQLKFVEQNHIDRERHIARILAGRVAELNMTAELSQGQDRVLRRARNAKRIDGDLRAPVGECLHRFHRIFGSGIDGVERANLPRGGVVDKACVCGGEWVVVHGCGGMGLSAVQIAAAVGGKVIAVDISGKPNT